jgi:hypothetical protein
MGEGIVLGPLSSALSLRMMGVGVPHLATPDPRHPNQSVTDTEIPPYALKRGAGS